MNKRNYDILVIGFALFSMFFGAGNLIFPPFLGLTSGSQWFYSFFSFIIADAGLALITLIAMALSDGTIEGITGRIGKWPAIILGAAVIICVGPLLAIPRTAATTYEMAIEPIFGEMNRFLVSIIYFGITLALTIRPSRVIDIIGKFLTPALLLALLALIVKGIVTPLGAIPEMNNISGALGDGLIAGYQSMDVLGSLALALIVLTTIVNKGYRSKADQVKMITGAGVIAGLGLVIVYCGLTYLGATAAGVFPADISRANLLIGITNGLLGFGGTVILGLIVGIACLTTSVGLTSASAQYFSKLTNNKLKYEVLVIGLSIFSMVVSTFGIDKIVAFATPILSIVYPAVLTLVGLSFFKKRIKNDNVYKFATAGAILISTLTTISTYNITIPFINSLPLTSVGLNWVIPTVIFGVIGAFIGRNKVDTV